MFSREEVERFQQLARDASLGGTFEERLRAVSEPFTALVPNASFSAFLILRPPLEVDDRSQRSFQREGDPALVLRYARDYMRFDPGPALGARHPGRFFPLSSYVAAADHGRDPYTGEFLPQAGVRYVVGGSLPLPDGSFLSLALHREAKQGDFTPRECEILALVGPDIARAATGALLRERASRLRSEDGGVWGYMLLDADGCTLEASPLAQALSRWLTPATRDALAHQASHLCASPGAREGDRLEMVLPGEGALLFAQVSLLTGGPEGRLLCVLEVLEQGSRRCFEACAQAIGLTPREREVARLAARGLGNLQIARTLEVAASTVGAHLRSAYRKAGVASRTELTTYLLGVSNSL